MSWMQWSLYFRISQRWTSCGCGCSIRFESYWLQNYLLWCADHPENSLPEHWHEFWQMLWPLVGFPGTCAWQGETGERKEWTSWLGKKAMSAWELTWSIDTASVTKTQTKYLSIFSCVKLLGSVQEDKNSQWCDKQERMFKTSQCSILWQVGKNLHVLSQLEGVDLEMYRDVVLPRVLEQVRPLL
jgi:hypothetical protein